MNSFKMCALFLVLIFHCTSAMYLSTNKEKGETPLHKVRLRLDKYLERHDLKIKNNNSGLFSSCCPGRRKSSQKLPTDAKFAVVLTTGAMNPIHKSHIRMLELAKEELEARNWIVLGGFLSSTHDQYVATKSEWIPGVHRKEMAIRALAKHEYIVHDNYEIDNSEFVHNTDVAYKLGKTLNSEFKDVDIKVFYIAGADRFKLAHGMLRTNSSHGSIVVKRDEIVLDKPTERQKHLFMETFGTEGKYFWIDDEENMQENLSSSEVRERIRTNQDISDLVPQEVADYMNEFDITFKEISIYEGENTIVWDFQKKTMKKKK